jgi:Arc/MetJ-type ribon-helix-helix transcriptional regulator
MAEKPSRKTLIVLDGGPDLRDSLDAVCDRLRVSKSEFIRQAVRDALDRYEDRYFQLEVLKQFCLSARVVMDQARNAGLLSKPIVEPIMRAFSPVREEIERKQAQLVAEARSTQPGSKFLFPARHKGTEKDRSVADIVSGLERIEDYISLANLERAEKETAQVR